MHRKFFQLFSVFAAILLTACKPDSASASPTKPQPPANVKLVQPKRGEIMRSVSLPAVIVANQQATLYSKTPASNLYATKLWLQKPF